MQANYAANIAAEKLLDPADSAWGGVKEETISLMGTPAVMQPTAAIRETWADKKIGSVSAVKIRALHNGSDLAFRLEWDAPNHNKDHGDNSVFPDGAAIAFPLVENAPVMMGAPKMPLNIWFWRANEQGGRGRQVVAEGIGTSDALKDEEVQVNSAWADGKWVVVIIRKLKTANSENAIQLTAGEAAQFSIAIWDGSSGERGGIKSFSGPAWLDLSLAAGS